MATAQDLISYVQETYPDFPAGTDGLRLLQESHNQICRHVRILQTSSVNLNLVSGTQEYAISDGILRIWAATYYTAPGAYQPLAETSYDELDYEARSWRDMPASTPTRYYDSGSFIGLVPAPIQTTSGGYPIVTLYVSQEQTLVTGTVMPANAPDYDAWISDVIARWAFRADRPSYEAARQIARMKLEDLASYIQGRQARNRPRAKLGVLGPISL